MDQDAYVQGWLVQAGVREEQERSQGRLVAPYTRAVPEGWTAAGDEDGTGWSWS